MNFKIHLIALVVMAVSVQADALKPTFADLSMLLAKGYFKEHVPADASMEQCVEFLNAQGVYFSVFDIMNPHKVVEREDLARVVGQSTLIFSGEADVVNGRVRRPLGVDTWLDYCLLNDIDLEPLWEGLVQRI